MSVRLRAVPGGRGFVAALITLAMVLGIDAPTASAVDDVPGFDRADVL